VNRCASFRGSLAWLTRVLLLGGVVAVGCARPAPASDWPGMPLVEVRAYLYNLDGAYKPPILVDGQLHPSVVDPAGLALDEAQILRLREAVRHDVPRTMIGACNTPRHAFVGYDAEGAPVTWVELCFDCNQFEVTPAVAHDIDLNALKVLCRDVGLPVLEIGDDYLRLADDSR
jgi:hypothetical protein